MKKALSILLVLFVLLTIKTQAQNGKVSSAEANLDPQYLNIPKAKQQLEEAFTSGKTKDMAFAHLVRAKLYYEIFKSEDTKIKGLEETPLEKAIDDLLECSKLDTKKEYTGQVKFLLQSIYPPVVNKGIESYNNKDYEDAVKNMILGVKINKGLDLIDTGVIYNTAIMAHEGEMFDVFKKYAIELIKLNFKNPAIYSMLANVYKEEKQIDSAIFILESAINEVKENTTYFINEMINIYLDTENDEKAKQYLATAIEKDPNNATYYFALGVMYNKKLEYYEAIAEYEKAIKINPDYFDALFNIGAIYNNLAIEKFDAANAVPTNQEKKYKKLKEEAEATLLKGKPYLERARKIKNDDINLLRALKDMYLRSKEMDKFNEVGEILKKLEEKE